MLSRSFQSLFSLIERMGRPCTVCLRVPLDQPEIEALLSQFLVESIILESENQDLLAAFPDRIGFYSKCGRYWQLPKKITADMFYVGRWNEFGARVAWLAVRVGIRHIHTLTMFSKVYTSHRTIRVAIEKSLKSLFYRLPHLGKLELGTGLVFWFEQYLFSRRLHAIENLPLPISDIPIVWNQEKIVLVGGTLGPGGAERQLATTLLGLFERGYQDVHFLYHAPMRKPNDFYLPQLIEAGISFSQIDHMGNYNTLPDRIEVKLQQYLFLLGDLGIEIATYAREFYIRRPNVVHIWLDQMNVVAGLAALLVGVPRIILSCRSLSPANFAFIQPYMRPIYLLLAKFSNVTFLNNSKAGSIDYKKWLGTTSLRIQIIRNGFDFSSLPSPQELLNLRGKYRRHLGIPTAALVVGVIMRISEEKRPLLWLDIARQVTSFMPEVHFLIVGDGPMRQQVEQVGKEVLQNRIHFPGHEKDNYMTIAAMDLFLMTSRIEGLPNVLLETQAVGVPPVAIDVGGVGEAMKNGESGWAIPTTDVSILCDKVVSLLVDKAALTKASHFGRKFALNEFGVKRMIDETLLAYGYDGKIKAKI